MSLPNDLRVPSLTNKDLLTGPATIEDVLHILKSMPKGKNPGPNDFIVWSSIYFIGRLLGNTILRLCPTSFSLLLFQIHRAEPILY